MSLVLRGAGILRVGGCFPLKFEELAEENGVAIVGEVERLYNKALLLDSALRKTLQLVDCKVIDNALHSVHSFVCQKAL